MATDSMFLRIDGGNVVNPTLIDSKISAHDFIAALQMWENREITRQNVIDAYDLTHADDSGDLDSLKNWFVAARAARLGGEFSKVVEWRSILARKKRTAAGGVDLDGKFGYAIQATFVGGADGVHSLKNTGPVAERFTTWAV